MGDGSLSFLLFSISLIKLRIIKIPKKYKHHDPNFQTELREISRKYYRFSILPFVSTSFSRVYKKKKIEKEERKETLKQGIVLLEHPVENVDRNGSRSAPTQRITGARRSVRYRISPNVCRINRGAGF